MELANRVNSTDSLNGQFYVRIKPTDGEPIVCRLGNSRETSITQDILDVVRKTRSSQMENVIQPRSNQMENVMQPRPKYRYYGMYPRPDNTENVNFPDPNEPINYIRQIPKE